MGERRERDRIAAFHVVDAGAVGAITLDAHRQRAGERADGMDRVHMPEDQDAGAVGFAGNTAEQDVGDAAFAGDALDGGADRAQDALGVN